MDGLKALLNNQTIAFRTHFISWIHVKVLIIDVVASYAFAAYFMSVITIIPYLLSCSVVANFGLYYMLL